MNIIPLIYFQKKKIYADKDGDPISLTTLFETIEKETELYVYDIDGIKKDKPNLCTYPKLSEHCKIWVDYGPRTLGDVVDAIMAGATSITIRKNLWPKADFSKIREISESTIYESFDGSHNLDEISFFSSQPETDGYVIYSDKEKFKKDVLYEDTVKSNCKKYNVAIIESDRGFFTHWKNLEVSILLTELNTWKKEEKYEF